jgi:hypothetical protein
MPPKVPKTPQDWWTWGRETLQTASPVNRIAQHAAMGVRPGIPEGVSPSGDTNPAVTGISTAPVTAGPVIPYVEPAVEPKYKFETK